MSLFEAELHAVSSIPNTIWDRAKYRLYANYPNPFNSVTTIAYDLPKDGQVKLNIYNISGQLVTTLVDEHKQAGRHKALWHANSVSTGLYFYEITADHFHDVKKMLLVK